MKQIILIIILLGTLSSKAQKLPTKITEQPDGLTISYFNSNTDNCLPRIFIGEDLKILFPCYSNGDYQRIDISKETDKINRIQNILTKEFVIKLNQCCYEKKCPDTIHGYYLMIKIGNEYYSQYLDLGHFNESKCGNKDLTELIEILNEVNNNYAQQSTELKNKL